MTGVKVWTPQQDEKKYCCSSGLPSTPSAPRASLLVLEAAAGKVYTIACIHGLDDMEKELNIMVDNGCTVINVTVEHPIYGQLTGQLQLSSRYDVSQFMEKLRKGEVAPLCQLTGGVHLHALSCPDEACFERTKAALADAGLLYE